MKYAYSLLLTFIATSLLGQVISKELDSEIKRRVNLEINPSLAIGVLSPDGTTNFYGYGYYDSSKKQPDSLTLYEIGSVTKTFTAILANIYLKDSINSPLSVFFTEIENPHLYSITPTDLRNHSAGVPRLSNQFSPQNWADPFNGYSNDMLQEEMQNLEPDTSSVWQYSNFGYSILGRAIEIVSGKSFENIMGHLIDDLGMDNTYLSVPSEEKKKIAEPTNIGTSNSNWIFTGPCRYAGGLISNTKDLLTYLKYQKQNNPLFFLDSIHSPIQTEVPILGKDKLYYKDGWFVLKPDSSTNILLHNGGTGGFISFIGFNKKTEVGVALISNSASMVDDIGIKILYPSFKLNSPERTIAYELADAVDTGNMDDLVSHFYNLKRDNYHNNILDIYWVERFHFGKGNYSISNQLSDIMIKELPEDWEVHDIKWQNFERLKDYSNALLAYEEALKLNPEMEVIKEKIKHCTIKLAVDKQ